MSSGVGGHKLGIHLGFSYTSCVTWSSEGGYEAHRFLPKGTSGRYIKTSLFCQATSTLDGVPLLRAQEGHTTLLDLLPSLLEMSHSPLEAADSEAVHMTGQRSHRSEGASSKVPHAFLWELFRDDTVDSAIQEEGGQHDAASPSLSSTIALRVERNTMEAAVFFVWLLRHVVDKIIANRYLHEPRGGQKKSGATVIESVAVSIPTCAFTAVPYKVTALAVAADAAASYVEQLFHGNVVIGKVRIVCDALSLVASQSASLGLPTSSAGTSEPIPSGDEDRVLLACHVGGVSSSFSFVRLPKDVSQDPFVLYGSVTDTSAAGGDAVDHAILHHILSHHQMAYIDAPLSADAKLLLLERICRAKEVCLSERSTVQVHLLCGPAAADPTSTFKLTVDVIENAATDTLFRKFTKALQQASASALQTSGCPKGVASLSHSSHSSDALKKRLESLPLQAMRLLRPAIVMTTGRGLLVSSLKKRVESLCRTLGTTGGTSSGSVMPVTFFHEQHDPQLEGMCGYGALVLEAWRTSPIAGLRSTALGATHRVSMGMLFDEPTAPHAQGPPAVTLSDDVLIRTHGDCWGMLAPRGTPLPLYRTRTMDLLNRSPADSLEGSGRFSVGAGGTSGGLLHSEVEICVHLEQGHMNSSSPLSPSDASNELYALCLMDVWLPKLSVAEGGSQRFSVTLDLQITHDGEVTVTVVHEASGVVLQKRSEKRAELVAQSHM